MNLHVPPAAATYTILGFGRATSANVATGERVCRVRLDTGREVEVRAPAAGTLVFARSNVLAPHAIDLPVAVVEEPLSDPRALMARTLALEEEMGGLGAPTGLDVEVKDWRGGNSFELTLMARFPPNWGSWLYRGVHADRREVDTCLAWARDESQRRGLPEPRVAWDGTDERGVPQSWIERRRSPDGRFVLELTLAAEPPWGPPLYTVRVLSADGHVLRDGGERQYFEPVWAPGEVRLTPSKGRREAWRVS